MSAYETYRLCCVRHECADDALARQTTDAADCLQRALGDIRARNFDRAEYHLRCVEVLVSELRRVVRRRECK